MRKQTRLAWMLLAAAIAGTAQQVLKDPAPRWAGAARSATETITSHMAEQNVPGLSVAVGVGGNIVWAAGFGWADIKTETPVTPETRFRIGTASEALTSAAAGVLIDRGRLSLDKEIQAYVPEFPKKRWPLTLQHLLADVSGVGSDAGEDAPLYRQRCEQPVEALPQFASQPLLFEPGTQYRRSSYGWILVSAAIEAAADEPFVRFLHDEVFEPLDMDDTGAESATEENPEHVGEDSEDPPIFTLIRQMILEPLGIAEARVRAATEPATVYLPGLGYDRLGHERFFGYRTHVMRPQNLSCYAGAMAFYSTPSDLVRFGLALNGGELLQPATVQLMQATQQLQSGRETGHGLGWDREETTLAGKPAQAVGFDGEIVGRRAATLIAFPEAGIVVAVTSNILDADTTTLAREVAEAFAQTALR